jgi:hypothetical protein
MGIREVAPGLERQLGPEASSELVDLLDAVEERCVNTVIERSVERFERRLTEEVSGLRVEMVQGQAALRQDVATLGGNLRQEMGNLRFDLLKWSFLFLTGQVVAMTGIVAMLLRVSGR